MNSLLVVLLASAVLLGMTSAQSFNLFPTLASSTAGGLLTLGAFGLPFLLANGGGNFFGGGGRRGPPVNFQPLNIPPYPRPFIGPYPPRFWYVFIHFLIIVYLFSSHVGRVFKVVVSWSKISR